MTRLTIRRFDVIRTANIVAALYAVIVLVIGLVFLLPIMLLAGAAAAEYGGEALAGGVVGVVVLLGLALLFYAALGWIMTAIVCALYNVVAARIGGMRLEVEVEAPSPSPVPPGGWQQPSVGYPSPGSGPSAPSQPGGPPQPPQGWGPPRG